MRSRIKQISGPCFTLDEDQGHLLNTLVIVRYETQSIASSHKWFLPLPTVSLVLVTRTESSNIHAYSSGACASKEPHMGNRLVSSDMVDASHPQSILNQSRNDRDPSYSDHTMRRTSTAAEGMIGTTAHEGSHSNLQPLQRDNMSRD